MYIEINIIWIIVLIALLLFYSLIDTIRYSEEADEYEKEIEELKRQLEEERKTIYIEYIRLDK